MQLTMFVLLCQAAFVGGISLFHQEEGPSSNRGTKPNIVFILIDDMGWKDAGFMGSHYYETPNVDRLASQGMVFTNAYANAANCAPTRASFLTGQYTPRHGVYTVDNSDRGASRDRRLIPIANDTTLDSRHVTIAEALKASGYVSAHIGKWHMGDPPILGPREQGFDLNIGGGSRGSPYGSTYFSPYGNPYLADGPSGEYLTDRLTDEALRFIEANKSRPFFLYLAHYAVHTPIQAKPEVAAKYETKRGNSGQDNARYAAMVEIVDLGVGRILQKLDELELTRNTVVVFFSDNGGHGSYTDMQPLRGSKGMPYEGGIRVPMIVHWTGTIQPGTRCAVPVISTDFFPTFLELSGTDKPPSKILDGVSLVPLLRGDTHLERDAIFWHFPAYLEAYSGGMDEARDPVFRSRPVGVIRKGSWKLLMFFEEWVLDGGWDKRSSNNAVELYNLDEDIAESRNLAEINTARRDELLQDLIDWQRAVGAQVPRQANPQYRR